MKRKLNRAAITIGTLACCTLGAHADLSETTEIEAEIREYLSHKGEVTRFELVESRGRCIPLRGHIAGESELYSYGASLASKTNQKEISYLVCVQVESDGTVSVEYLLDE